MSKSTIFGKYKVINPFEITLRENIFINHSSAIKKKSPEFLKSFCFKKDMEIEIAECEIVSDLKSICFYELPHNEVAVVGFRFNLDDDFEPIIEPYIKNLRKLP